MICVFFCSLFKGSSFVSGSNFVVSDYRKKSVTWLPEIISGEFISVGLPKSLARSQRSVRR